MFKGHISFLLITAYHLHQLHFLLLVIIDITEFKPVLSEDSYMYFKI